MTTRLMILEIGSEIEIQVFVWMIVGPSLRILLLVIVLINVQMGIGGIKVI